ncbi:MAG: hypothetical protein ACRDBH_12960 [Bosea sp. (in: a-proteobacteria)]
MTKLRDEKTKLLANLLNTCAGTSIGVGVVAPSVAVFLNFGEAGLKVPVWALALNVVFWTLSAIVLHIIARRILDGLSE